MLSYHSRLVEGRLTDTPGTILAPVDAPRRLSEDIWVLPYDFLG